MSGFQNPFGKKPVNPFADPSVAQQQQGDQLQPVQGFGDDMETVPQAGGGAWGQPSMGSGGAWGGGGSGGGASKAQPQQNWDSTPQSHVPSQPSIQEAPKQSTGMFGWGSKQKEAPASAPKDQGSGWGQQQQQGNFPTPQQPSWGQNFGMSSAPANEDNGNPNIQTSASLRKREADLQKREKELKALETQVQKNGGQVNKKNFPPLISCCYHSISKEIPENNKSILRQVFASFFVVEAALIFNLLAVCVGFGGFGSGEHILPFVLAIIYVAIGCPAAWFLWYRRLYHAMAKNGLFGYIMYLIFNVFSIGFSVWNAIGPPVGGFIKNSEQASAGIVPAIQLFQNKQGGAGAKVAGVFYIIGFAIWALTAAFCVYLEIRVGRHFRSNGGAAKVQKGAQAAGAAASRFDRI